MSMKAVLQEDHAAVNSYDLQVSGLPVSLTLTVISEIESMLDTVLLPDRTAASGGRTAPSEFTVSLPAHHTAERAAMELWFQTCHDPVLPTYKLPGTLTMKTISGAVAATYTLLGLFVKGRKLPSLEMDNDGDLAVIEWTMSVDEVLPI